MMLVGNFLWLIELWITVSGMPWKTYSEEGDSGRWFLKCNDGVKRRMVVISDKETCNVLKLKDGSMQKR